MKTNKYWILITLIVAVCGIGAILIRHNSMVNQKTIRNPVSHTNVADEGTNITDRDRENKQLRERVRRLEDTISKLEENIEKDKIRKGNETFPGLRGSLIGLPAIGVKIKDIPLTAIRYGLTKQNIQNTVMSILAKHNIKSFDDSNFSEWSQEETILRVATSNKPKIVIEIDCIEYKGGFYVGQITVSMCQFWYTEDDPFYSREKIENIKKQGIYALEKPIKTHDYSTTWERRCILYFGKMDTFAEEERNALEELIDAFINDYLAANSKEKPAKKESMEERH